MLFLLKKLHIFPLFIPVPTNSATHQLFSGLWFNHPLAPSPSTTEHWNAHTPLLDCKKFIHYPWKGYKMVLEKSWVSANFRRVSKSLQHKLESRNLELAKIKLHDLGNFRILKFESPSLANLVEL